LGDGKTSSTHYFIKSHFLKKKIIFLFKKPGEVPTHHFPVT